ncbi:MAG: GNAT family N-acetyltransferase, partial [Gammaproteobacteria bacterium]|nr:GNAT family N-acetyltransferase [Gammaproteobacteria bacterium]
MLTHPELAQLAAYQKNCVKNHTRGTYVFNGRVDEIKPLLDQVCEQVFHTTPQKLSGVDRSHIARLGDEQECLLLDCHAGIDPDVLGAVSGLVTGGGALVLLLPNLNAQDPIWQQFNETLSIYPYDNSQIGTRFIQRFIAKLEKFSQACFIGADQVRVAAVESLPEREMAAAPFATKDQEVAVANIRRVLSGHRNRPLVLTSHRGRGKSAALGIASAQLLKQGRKRILVTGPNSTATRSLFKHAAKELEIEGSLKPFIEWEKGLIEFVALDELSSYPHEVDLVLVDEAAAIPTAILKNIVYIHSRVVFATTQHGYEGNGKGFQFRFIPYLDAQCAGWRSQFMNQAVRWNDGDALEAFISDTLLLDADIDELVDEKIDALEYREIARDELLHQEDLLRSIFSLLVNAHYRTSPHDLMQLMDGPNISVHVLMTNKKVIATALVAKEGEIDSALADEIYTAKRRIKGHILAQSLTAQCAVKNSAKLFYSRIIRIAVHPELKRKGVGSKLLNQIEEASSVDVLGASFGASTELVQFWLANGYLPVRLGFSKESSSGAHAALVIKAKSHLGQQVLNLAYNRFNENFLLQLGDIFSTIDSELACTLLAALQQNLAALNEDEIEQLRLYALERRNLEDGIAALLKCTVLILKNQIHVEGMNIEQKRLLLEKFLQHRKSSELAQGFKLKGKQDV